MLSTSIAGGQEDNADSGAVTSEAAIPEPGQAPPPEEARPAVETEQNQKAATDTEKPKNKIKLDWMFLINPTAGYLHNEVTFKFKVPHQGTFVERHATLSDGGAGGGLTLVGFYKWISLTNITFIFPDVNSSKLYGNITYLSGEIPTGTFVSPYIGLGFVYHFTDTDMNDLNIQDKQESLGTTYIAYANMKNMSVDVQLISPFPKLGLRFDIPVQHWYVMPFYSFLYENVQTHARSPGGHVDVYEEGMRDIKPPEVSVDIPEFDTELTKEYFSNLVGVDMFLDFHYFLQLRNKVYYNTNYNLWTVRSIGSILFYKWLGMSIYFEYSQKITVTNVYFLAGPSFLLTPAGFFDNIKHGGGKK